MLISGGHSDSMNGLFLVDVVNAAQNSALPMVDHTVVQDMLIEAFVYAPVGGFLADKTFDILGKLGLPFR